MLDSPFIKSNPSMGGTAYWATFRYSSLYAVCLQRSRQFINGLLRRTWESLKEVMAPGALDPLTKEMLYLAVSTTNSCEYCIASHTAAARKAGMTDEMLGELMGVV